MGIHEAPFRDKIAKTFFDWLDNDDAAAKIGRVIELFHHPIEKSAEKSAFAKLNHLLGKFHIDLHNVFQ